MHNIEIANHPLLFTKKLEMGIDHGSFFRLIPLGLPAKSVIDIHHDDEFQTAKMMIDAHIEDLRIHIELEAQTTRQLGLIALPVTHVGFDFYGLHYETATQRFQRIMLSMQRGGG
ncbi:MAG: hypothetical protein AB8B77_05285 [Alphaproteobacteria bacterium]